MNQSQPSKSSSTFNESTDTTQVKAYEAENLLSGGFATLATDTKPEPVAQSGLLFSIPELMAVMLPPSEHEATKEVTLLLFPWCMLKISQSLMWPLRKLESPGQIRELYSDDVG